MERRDVIKAAIWSGAAMMLVPGQALARQYYPSQVDEALWRGVNRAKDTGKKTGLAMLHSPVITAPEKIKAGEVFPVEVSIGQRPHPMGPSHWIEYLQLSIGNEPAGTVTFRSRGYVKANAKFNVFLDESLKGKTVSLIVQTKCNLHGLWQNYANIEIV